MFCIVSPLPVLFQSPAKLQMKDLVASRAGLKTIICPRLIRVRV